MFAEMGCPQLWKIFIQYEGIDNEQVFNLSWLMKLETKVFNELRK